MVLLTMKDFDVFRNTHIKCVCVYFDTKCIIYIFETVSSFFFFSKLNCIFIFEHIQKVLDASEENLFG